MTEYEKGGPDPESASFPRENGPQVEDKFGHWSHAVADCRKTPSRLALQIGVMLAISAVIAPATCSASQSPSAAEKACVRKGRLGSYRLRIPCEHIFVDFRYKSSDLPPSDDFPALELFSVAFSIDKLRPAQSNEDWKDANRYFLHESANSGWASLTFRVNVMHQDARRRIEFFLSNPFLRVHPADTAMPETYGLQHIGSQHMPGRFPDGIEDLFWDSNTESTVIDCMTYKEAMERGLLRSCKEYVYIENGKVSVEVLQLHDLTPLLESWRERRSAIENLFNSYTVSPASANSTINK